jgi:hypothetical protein
MSLLNPSKPIGLIHKMRLLNLLFFHVLRYMPIQGNLLDLIEVQNNPLRISLVETCLILDPRH